LSRSFFDESSSRSEIGDVRIFAGQELLDGEDLDPIVVLACLI